MDKIPIWLFAHPSQDKLAEEIANESKKSNNRLISHKNNVKWRVFEDGFPNLFIENVKDMAGKHVVFLASFHEPSVIFEQVSLMHAIPRYLAKSFTVLLPYFPCATMECVSEEGQVATAKSVANLFCGVPLSHNGPCQIMVFDIHALQERFYFPDNVVPRMETAVPLFTAQLNILRASPDHPPIAFAFPDDGAKKRFGKSVKIGLHKAGVPGNVAMDDEDEIQEIVCTKIRHESHRIVKIREGDPRGCHVIIVDDLVRSGGTLIECAKALLAAGALKVSAFVVHAVFPELSWHQFVPSLASQPSETAIFDTFWITDSIPHSRLIAQHPPFVILSLASLFKDIKLV